MDQQQPQESSGVGFVTHHTSPDGHLYFFNMAHNQTWWANEAQQQEHERQSLKANKKKQREQQKLFSGRSGSVREKVSYQDVTDDTTTSDNAKEAAEIAAQRAAAVAAIIAADAARQTNETDMINARVAHLVEQRQRRQLQPNELGMGAATTATLPGTTSSGVSASSSAYLRAVEELTERESHAQSHGGKWLVR